MAKFAAFGTLFKRGAGDGPPETFATVANVRNIGGPNLSRAMLDATTHDSTDGWDEFIAGIKSGGEVTLDVLYDPDGTTHQNIRTDFENGTQRNWKLVFPDTAPATEWLIPGKVQNYGSTAPHNELLGLAVTIKVSGKPTLA